MRPMGRSSKAKGACLDSACAVLLPYVLWAVHYQAVWQHSCIYQADCSSQPAAASVHKQRPACCLALLVVYCYQQLVCSC